MSTTHQINIDRSKAPEVNRVEKLKVIPALMKKLDNEMPVYHINAGTQDIVKLEILLNRNAPFPGQLLLPDAVNRMLAEGTANMDAQEIADRIDYYGAFYGTEETYDYSSVHLFTLNKHLYRLLPVLKEILTQPKFPEKELSVFVQNSRQQLIISEEKVNTVARKIFTEMLYGIRHPYGHHTTLHEFEALNREEMLAYHRSQYMTGNYELLIAGKVTDKNLDLLNEHFGSLERYAGSADEHQFPVNAGVLPKKHRVIKEKAIQSAIRIGRILINRTHPDYPGFAVLNCILGGYFGSRLMSNIREEKGYTYGIGSGVMSLRHSGYFSIQTEVGASVMEEALKEIYFEIKRLREEPVSREELETVRNYMFGQFIKGLETAFNLADRFKSIHVHGLSYSYFEHYLDVLSTITPQDILELANRYLQEDDLHELVVGPN